MINIVLSLIVVKLNKRVNGCKFISRMKLQIILLNIRKFIINEISQQKMLYYCNVLSEELS